MLWHSGLSIGMSKIFKMLS